MMRRIGFALFALLGLTAFAPAPFPRAEKPSQKDEVSLKIFQGLWRVTNMQISRAGGRLDPDKALFTHVRVEQDAWTFMVNTVPGNRLLISIDATKKPARLNFYRGAAGQPQELFGVAIIRRRGDEVQVAYCWNGEDNRPASFDPLPAGLWLVTLRRQ